MKSEKCPSCGEAIKADEVDNLYTTLTGAQWCGNCYQYAQEFSCSAFKFGPGINGQEYPERFTKEFGNDDRELPEPIAEVLWVKTDPWRGYTDWKLRPGFIAISEGWVTGYPDETTSRKMELHNYYEQLRSGELVPPVEIWWLFGFTSNVFSTASEIVCREEDLDALKEWLEEINGGEKHFAELFA